MRPKPHSINSVFRKGVPLAKAHPASGTLPQPAGCLQSGANPAITLRHSPPCHGHVQGQYSRSHPTRRDQHPLATIRPAPTKAPALSQDDLKAEWRFPFKAANILFSSCELIYDTHVRFKRGEFDKDLAATSPLDRTCSAFYSMQSEIYQTMKAAGLTITSINELGTEFDGILNYLYGSIRG